MERGRFNEFADRAARVPSPKEEELVLDPDGLDFDGDFDISLAVKIKEAPLRMDLALPLPSSWKIAYPDGAVPEPVARLVKVSAREIINGYVKELLKVPGTARNLLICMRSAERTLKGTSGNQFILALAYFFASELHWGKRYILPESAEGFSYIAGDSGLKEKRYEDPGSEPPASRMSFIHK